MITLIVGPNSFARDHVLARIRAAFDGVPESFDGDTLTPRDLPELVMGATLFAPTRLVIVRALSESKEAWDALPAYLEQVDDSIHLVLVETSIDKRTKAYKQLAKFATVVDAALLMQRDEPQAIKWLLDEAVRRGAELSRQQATHMIGRALVPGDKPGAAYIDQGMLAQALEVLSLKSSIQDEDIARVLPPTPQENIFELLEAALRRQPARVDEMIQVFAPHQEAYMALGLLSGQVAQLAALKFADKPSAAVAAEIGAHPFVMSKLAPLARSLLASELRQIVTAFADADDRIKSSATDPWTILWYALTTIARR